MVDDEFFKNYKKSVEKTKGIPNVVMNMPVSQNIFTGTVGLELEVEALAPLPRDGHLDFTSPLTKTSWLAVADGSLRGEAREYIFSQPCAREEVDFMVTRLFDKFKDMKSKINNSNRCSTHVHINMKGRTVNQLTSVIALWATFEESLIAWCGEERVTNHFCLSMQNSRSLVEAWNQYLRVGQFEGMGQDRHGLKYMAFNILPLWRKGSFEFRCGGSPNDPKTVTTWATFLDAFVEYACTRYTLPVTIASDLSERGAAAILEEICSSHKEFFAEVVGKDIEEFNERCLKGFRVVQPLVLGYPWETWMELINKQYIPDPFAKPKRGATLVINGIPTVPAPRPRANIAGRLAERRTLHHPLPPGVRHGVDPNGWPVDLMSGRPLRSDFETLHQFDARSQFNERMRREGHVWNVSRGCYIDRNTARALVLSAQEDPVEVEDIIEDEAEFG